MLRRPLPTLIFVLVTCLTATAHAQVTYTDDYKLYWERVGFNQLKAELGAATPTGAGVGLSHVEAFSGGGYAPGTVNNTTLTGTSQGKTYILKSGTTVASGHAGSVARFLYGDLSMSRGISTIHSYSASGWFYSNLLLYGSPPAAETNKVSSHSYHYNNYVADPMLLRKLDYSIDRDQYTAVVATAPGGQLTPNLSASYNAITVGRSDIDNNNYVTGRIVGDEGAGQSKPDIVSPERMSSYTTPIVASAAALMWQTVQDKPELSQGRNPQTIKAALMAGATKDPFMQPTTPTALKWSRTPTTPLPATWGAGQVNVYNSYHILTAGRQTPGASLLERGWDFNTTTAAAPQTYYFDLTSGSTTLDDLSIILTWHRMITPAGGTDWFDMQASLANLDLKLFAMNGPSLGALIDQSISTIDNVEHIFLPTSLAPGQYALQVTSSTADVDYALAWNAKSVPVPEPVGTGILAIALFSLARRNRIAA